MRMAWPICYDVVASAKIDLEGEAGGGLGRSCSWEGREAAGDIVNQSVWLLVPVPLLDTEPSAARRQPSHLPTPLAPLAAGHRHS